jgi:hydroxymethylglutaryl-CoA lyase
MQAITNKITPIIKYIPRVRIYEMFMRDGLQSLNKVYPLETKIMFMNELNKCNFDCIEFGSTTSPKLLPQMENSFELFSNFSKINNTKYTMLVPGITQIQKTIDTGVNSFGIVCSISDTFAHKNLKKKSIDTFNNVSEQLKIITNTPNPHIRVYLSCSFGSPWENFDKDYLKILENYTNKLLEFAKEKNISSHNFDIVISDTVGLSDEIRTDEIIKMINYNFNSSNKEYIAMHIHSSGDKFKNLINTCVDNNICKFDSSMLGIGGCPFAEDEALGNISTVKLIEFLKTTGYCNNYDLNKLKRCEFNLKRLLEQ